MAEIVWHRRETRRQTENTNVTPTAPEDLSLLDKNSCGVARVVFQEPSKPFATLNRAFALRVLADRRKEQDVALALMIPLVMIMLHVLIEGATQGCFSKQNHPPETLLLDGSDPPLRVGIQVWRSGWQDDTLDTGIINDVLKRGTELGVAVMDEILTGLWRFFVVLRWFTQKTLQDGKIIAQFGRLLAGRL